MYLVTQCLNENQNVKLTVEWSECIYMEFVMSVLYANMKEIF